jgi:hypothetical protein
MNALQPIESPSYSRSIPQRNSRRNPKRRLKTDGGVAVEIGMKLVVNGILSVAAIAALVRLLPYQFTQQAKLQEIRLEVSETEARVNTLRQNFNRYFDPTQAKKVMQEQSPRLDPNQRRVILLPR